MKEILNYSDFNFNYIKKIKKIDERMFVVYNMVIEKYKCIECVIIYITICIK